MARKIQIRRGTTAQNNTFIGGEGEVTMDTDVKTLRVHDGVTPGGVALARADSVTDMSGAEYVVAFQAPTAANGYTWYRKYKSGWVEQGGILPCDSKTSETTIFIFPLKMLAGYTYQTTALKNTGTWNNNNAGGIYVRDVQETCHKIKLINQAGSV